jgi:GNAT superfamily N-acetyltransferase
MVRKSSKLKKAGETPKKAAASTKKKTTQKAVPAGDKTAQAAPPVIRAASNLRTRAAKEQDFDFVWPIYRDAVRPFVEPKLDRKWDDEEELHRFKNLWRPSESYIITCEGEMIGWYAARVTERRATIHHFAIATPHRGKGHATQLLTKLLQTWTSEGREVEASALKGSRQAVLYQRLGGQQTRKDELAVFMMWKRR